MRLGLEKRLESFGAIAKDKQREGLTNEEQTKLDHVLDWNISKAAERTRTQKQDQFKIYDLQEKKQEIMTWLNNEIANLDNPEYRLEKKKGDRVVNFKDGKFWGNDNEEITVGEIMTDGEWGIDYYLDSESVPRKIRKRYLIESAKRKLSDFLDKQIMINEVASPSVDGMKKKAYEANMGEKENGIERSGMIAERMVKNLFKKMSYDYGVDFEVLEADIFQDVEQKIDFIIHRKTHSRGVRTEVDENKEKENVGIQFTINTRRDVIGHKKAQIKKSKEKLNSGQDKIDDLVLVSVPMGHISRQYGQWIKKGKPSGGVDKMLPIEQKEIIFKNVLKDVLSPEEIEVHWNLVKEKN